MSEVSEMIGITTAYSKSELEMLHQAFKELYYELPCPSGGVICESCEHKCFCDDVRSTTTFLRQRIKEMEMEEHE